VWEIDANSAALESQPVENYALSLGSPGKRKKRAFDTKVWQKMGDIN